ncbi:alpha/beta fold hydrolase [Patulibacter minatonensis]|uniref:alpha/beta fold hydrolase n=1 Tax=Patulibacter minatonensis TaxID=298163 RepID=UPI00146FA4D0|nr:alpha/beta hydrolase [Patulibacter minatonensis]
MPTGPSDHDGVEHWTTIDWSRHTRDTVIDGRRIRYVDYGSGTPIVLIHGLGGSWQTWLENLPALGREHRVVAVDLGGFGLSEPLPAPAAMATQSERIVTLMRQLDLGPATIVGHSMGGIVALGIVAAEPDVVGRLVLANAGGIPLSPGRVRIIVTGFKLFNLVFGRPGVMRAVARRSRLRNALFAGFIGDPRTMTAALAAHVVPAIAAPGFVAAVIAASEVVRTLNAEEVECPILLIWGAADRILPLAGAELLVTQLHDGELVVLDGVGHCPMFEAPERFNRALLDFTRTPDTAGAST